jgi:hypothetical protein
MHQDFMLNLFLKMRRDDVCFGNDVKDDVVSHSQH